MNDLMAQLRDRLMGGGATTIPTGATTQEKFLHVVAYGINWQAPEGERSSHDFAKTIDFDILVVQTPDVLERYLHYVQEHVLEKIENDYAYASAPDFDDSLVDALSVLERIVAAAGRSGVGAAVNDAQANDILEATSFIQDMISEEADLEEDDSVVVATFKSFRDFVEKLSRKTPAARPKP